LGNLGCARVTGNQEVMPRMDSQTDVSQKSASRKIHHMGNDKRPCVYEYRGKPIPRITGERGPGRPALSSAVELAVARVGKCPKDDAGVCIDGLPDIHGERENNDKEEQIDAKQRMQ